MFWPACRQHVKQQTRYENVPVADQKRLVRSRLGVFRADLFLEILQARRRATRQDLDGDTCRGKRTIHNETRAADIVSLTNKGRRKLA